MKRMTRCMAVVITMVAVGLTGCRQGAPSRTQAPADSAAGAISFELAGPGGVAILVPVSINGEGPFDFVLDTGATLTCLDSALAEQLQLPEATGAMGFQASPAGRGRAQLVEIDSMRVGEAAAFDLTGCVIAMESLQVGGLELQGLLGLNFLREFHVSLDFGENVLHLSKP